MNPEPQNWHRTSVDLSLFSMPIVLGACYRMLDRYEFDLQPAGTDSLTVRVRPLSDTPSPSPSGTEPSTLFQRWLTREAMQRQAKYDHKPLRALFAEGALSLELPADHLKEMMVRLVEAPPAGKPATDTPMADPILESAPEGNRLEMLLSAGIPLPTLFRSLSRLHDVSDAVVQNRDQHGRIRLSVELPPEVAAAKWEEAFRSLLDQCHDEGLPATYITDDSIFSVRQ